MLFLFRDDRTGCVIVLPTKTGNREPWLRNEISTIGPFHNSSKTQRGS